MIVNKTAGTVFAGVRFCTFLQKLQPEIKGCRGQNMLELLLFVDPEHYSDRKESFILEAFRHKRIAVCVPH